MSNSPIQQPREITFTLNKPLRMNSVSCLNLSKYDTVRTVKMEIYNGFDVGQFAAMLKRMVIESNLILFKSKSFWIVESW